MNIIQAGVAKSGNYWLYKIIDNIIILSGVQKKSNIKVDPISEVATSWKLSFPEQASIDFVKTVEGQAYYGISNIYQRPILDIDQYVKSTTHIWSHSTCNEVIKKFYQKADKVIYIIRDPRDVLLSLASFSFTPYMINTRGKRFKNKEEFIDVKIDGFAKNWETNVISHLQFARENNNIHIIFYENLYNHFDDELKKMLSFLSLELTADERTIIQKEASFNNMQKESPYHVRKGGIYKWKGVMNDEWIKKFNKIKLLLQQLNYPLSREQSFLPQCEREEFGEKFNYKVQKAKNIFTRMKSKLAN